MNQSNVSDSTDEIEIKKYKKSLMNFAVHLENKRGTEEFNRLKKIVATLSGEIVSLRTLGVTYKEIACCLKPEGLVIDGDTLQDFHLDKLCHEILEKKLLDERSERVKKKAEDARDNFLETCRKPRAEAELVVAPALTSAPSPASEEAAENQGAVCAASPPAIQEKGNLPEPSAAQVAAVTDRDFERILGNVIDVSKIPKRED